MPRSDPVRDEARELIAQQFDLLGPAWRNTAGLVRGGYENLWLRPALDALVATMLLSGYEPEDEK